LMRRSAPQPATRATPTGGTKHIVSYSVCMVFGVLCRWCWAAHGRVGGRTEDGDDDEQECGQHVGDVVLVTRESKCGMSRGEVRSRYRE